LSTALELADPVVVGVVVDSAEPDTALRPLASPRPADRNPYWVYLGRLRSEESRRTMQGALDRLAHLLLDLPLPRKAIVAKPGRTGHAAVRASVTGEAIPWEDLRDWHTARLAALVAEQGWSPAYANTHLIALRRVLKECWRLRLMNAEDYQRAADLEKAGGSREVAGRMLDRAEIRAHLDACAAAGDAKGIRDAALLAVANSTGSRRAELVRADLADWNASTGLLLRGKGNKHRRVPLAPWVAPYLGAWLQVRGMRPGPLLTRCTRWGGVTLERLTGQTVVDVLRDRAAEARTAPASPHDMRRTFASTLLDDPETDLVTVQTLMGHQSPQTTSRYDRRGEKAGRAAVNRLPDPHAD
jgi:integrase